MPRKQIKKTKLKDIVLYDGSLEELNSVSKTKYKVADLEYYTTTFTENNFDFWDDAVQGSRNNESLFKDVKEKIRGKNYDGLVNKRIIHLSKEKGGLGQDDLQGWFIYGTPIVRTNNNSHKLNSKL